MAITRLKLKPETWEGAASSQRNGLLYEVIRRVYSATYVCHTSKPVFGPEGILTDPACFQIGSAYAIFEDSDSVATCVNVSARSTKNPQLWEIDVTFDTDRIISAVTDNPLNQPPVISWSFVKAERPLLRTTDGIAVHNSSKERFDPSLTYEEIRPLLRIVRNEATFSPSNALTYQNALNAEPFAGAAILCAKVNSITGDQQLSNGILFYQVTYEIEFRREGFAYLVLDQGFRDKDKKLFRDPIDFAPLSTETFLNGRGMKLADVLGALSDAIDDIETEITFSDYNDFPPGREVTNSGGWVPSGDWTFDIRVDDEIMTVTTDKESIENGEPVTVIRGVANTVAAEHIADAAVTLEPYFKRFLPFQVRSFTPLGLPVI